VKYVGLVAPIMNGILIILVRTIGLIKNSIEEGHHSEFPLKGPIAKVTTHCLVINIIFPESLTQPK
jgi:hypothetical protein